MIISVSEILNLNIERQVPDELRDCQEALRAKARDFDEALSPQHQHQP